MQVEQKMDGGAAKTGFYPLVESAVVGGLWAISGELFCLLFVRLSKLGPFPLDNRRDVGVRAWVSEYIHKRSIPIEWGLGNTLSRKYEQYQGSINVQGPRGWQ